MDNGLPTHQRMGLFNLPHGSAFMVILDVIPGILYPSVLYTLVY